MISSKDDFGASMFATRRDLVLWSRPFINIHYPSSATINRIRYRDGFIVSRCKARHARRRAFATCVRERLIFSRLSFHPERIFRNAFWWSAGTSVPRSIRRERHHRDIPIGHLACSISPRTRVGACEKHRARARRQFSALLSWTDIHLPYRERETIPGAVQLMLIVTIMRANNETARERYSSA